MLALILQFLMEFIRALVIDGLSECVRAMREEQQSRRRCRAHSRKALRSIRNLSTDKHRGAC